MIGIVIPAHNEEASAGAIALSLQARNVGVDRAAGAEFMLARGAQWSPGGFPDALIQVIVQRLQGLAPRGT